MAYRHQLIPSSDEVAPYDWLDLSTNVRNPQFRRTTVYPGAETGLLYPFHPRIV